MSLNQHVMWGLPRDVQAWRHAFDRFAEFGDNPPTDAAAWTPRVDIREDEKCFVILADIPGVDPAGIEVSMDKGILAIKGERAPAEGRFSRQERSYGSFHRRFSLPDSADADGITANGKFGVLEIVIPKKAETTPRRIAINH